MVGENKGVDLQTAPEGLKSSLSQVESAKTTDDLYNLFEQLNNEDGLKHIADLIKYMIDNGEVEKAFYLIAKDPDLVIDLLLEDEESNSTIVSYMKYYAERGDTEKKYLLTWIKKIGGPIEEEILFFLSDYSSLLQIYPDYKIRIIERKFIDDKIKDKILINIFYYELKQCLYDIAFNTVMPLEDRDRDYFQKIAVNMALINRGDQITYRFLLDVSFFDSRLIAFLELAKHYYHNGDLDLAFNMLLESKCYIAKSLDTPGTETVAITGIDLFEDICQKYIEEKKYDELYVQLDKLPESNCDEFFYRLLLLNNGKLNQELFNKILGYIKDDNIKSIFNGKNE